MFRVSLKKIFKLGKIKEIAITRPFLELQTSDLAWTPYFAWKFVWTVQPNDKIQKYKKTKYKSTTQKSSKCEKCNKNVKCTKRKKMKKELKYKKQVTCMPAFITKNEKKKFKWYIFCFQNT